MKIIKVVSCERCPYYGNGLFGKQKMCVCTNRIIEESCSSETPFPTWCPLKDEPGSKKNKKSSGSKVNDKAKEIVASVYEMYAKKCPNLKQIDVSKMTTSMVKNCLIGIRHCKEENLEKLFSMVAKSDFLNGRGKSIWKADFIWIFRPARGVDSWNVDKILSGMYSAESNVKQADFVDKKRTYGEWK